jgi:PAS domain S-box-containing protein
MRTPKNLLQQEKSYQALLQSVTEYVIAVNKDYQIIIANDLFKNKFDMDPGGLCYRILKNRDVKCENCLMEMCYQDGKIHWNEETFELKDGKTAQMRVKATPVKNERGKIVYILETATDLTEKKYLQEELNRRAGNLERLITDRLRHLEKSEERYRTIFERSRDGIILTDSNGKIIEVNQAGVEILGYARKKELLSLGPTSQLFEKKDDLYHLLKALSKKGFVTEFETRLKVKQGQVFDALITSNVIFDIIGQIIGYVLIIRDITKRKKAQEQLKAQNIRLASINNISTTISSSLDLNEVLNRTTDRICKIFGSDCVRIYLLDKQRGILNLASHRGLSKEFIEMSHVRSRKIGDGLLGRTVLTGKVHHVDNLLSSEDQYVKILVKQGLKSTIYIPLVSKGEPVGVMSVCSITPFKFSPDDAEFLTSIGNQIGLAVHNADLYENIKNAYEELKEVQEQVIRSEKLASLGKLAATIAHEINNPLSAVLTYIRLMMKLIGRDRFTEERLGDISRYLSTMEMETSRCGEIVKNLLAFSRQSKTAIETHSMKEIIERSLALIAHELKLDGIKIVKEIEPNLPNVQCDSKQIQQVLLNLMGNAAEAMADGGILTITVRRSERDGFLDVVISDTGCGISKENLKNIFEPFFTTKQEGKGVGLGLSIAYGIIARHNGSIEVKSRLKKGSSFKVVLPIS